jgi:UDP-N-acetylmuramate dehydrogenase
MIRLTNNFKLKNYNTFGLDAEAKRFFEFTEPDELAFFLHNEGLPEKFLILGGGSNLLFNGDFDGLIIHPNVPGVGEVKEDRNFVYIEAGAGVEWDELVRLSVVYELGGLENLSLIPGKVGAAPVQNVGAYGVEAQEHIHLVRAISLEDGSPVEFTNEECRFAYRDSIFKNELKNKVVITSVVFKLDKFPDYKLGYGALKQEVEKLGEVNLHNLRQAVIHIRESKLPDPKQLGNAGSFFKNPVINTTEAERIIKSFEQVPHYPSADGKSIKLAAGWLIDQCGWKGYRKGNVGVHNEQALVLVNYGGATGFELVNLAEKIKASVFDKFGLELEPEVKIIG